MESHASASMYIPSSKVLARLQRHATAMDGLKASNVGVSGGSGLPATSGALSPESSGGSNLFEADPKTATTDTLAALSTASAKMDGAAVLVERSATVSKPSGAAGRSPSAHGAPSTFSASPTSNSFPTRALPPSESITPGAALGAHTAASDAARPPSMLKSPTAFTVASSQMHGSHTNSSRAVRGVPMAVEIHEAAPQRLPSPAETSSSPALSPPSASSPTASAWLLPQEDVTYILASLTWNVDLLRLLLPHAPCPLRLPGAEPPAATPCSAAGGPAAATARTSAPASATPRSIDVKEEEASTEAAHEGLAAKSVAKSSTCEAAAVDAASSAGTLLSPQVDKPGDTSSATSKMSTSAAYGQEAYVTRDNSAAITAVATNPRSLPPSPTSSSAPTTSVAVSGNSEAVSTGPLTWSQYLFRGAGRGGVRAVVGRERNTATCMLGDGAAGPPQQPLWFARGQATPTELVQGVHKGLPHSHSDGALVLDPKTSAGTPTAAPNSPYVSSSIFHAQYLPSLEEFQRKLEEHKHRQQLLLREQQQQQQQHMPTLSATRLQKHLQQQQQQHESPHHHYRRRAAANKMFFYSPTPSVVSLATTAATTAVNANTTDENWKEELKPCQPSGVCPSSLPPSPSASSASPARRGLPNTQRLLGPSGLCLRPCTSSTSLDNLVNGGGSSSDNEVARVGIGATAATSCMSYSTPDSSCPSPPRPQQLSVMRLRAADQLRGFTVPSSAQGQSPLLLYAGDGRSASRNSRGSSRATAPDDRDDNGEENGEDEEWASICRGISGRGGVRSSISLPASPTVSISSMSFSRVWSSTLSGRATPRTTLATGVGSTVATHHSNFNSGNLSCVGYASPYATSKGRKNARRRRKTACTRRRRIMRVYVPSITEGPKAASLYTAPTAEAQELLLQLQHRAAPSFVSGSAGKLIGGHSAASTAVSAAWPRTTTSATPPATPSCGTAASPRPSTSAEAAHASSRSSGNPAGVPTAGQAERPQHGFTRPNVGSPRPPRNSGEAAQTPQLLTLPQPLRSHETAADLFSASRSSGAAAPPSAAAAEPTSRSFTSSGSIGHGRPDDFREEVGGAGRSDGPVKALEDTSTETPQQQWSAPPSAAEPVAPLELPQWVRERPLSALYYQPWGLKLLARYEASRHEQQLRRARMLRRMGPGVCSNTTTAGAAVSEVRVNRNNSSPATSMCSSSSSGGGTSPYMMSSPAAQTAAQHAPVLSRPSLGTSRVSCPSTATAAGAGNTSSPSSSGIPHVSWAAALRQPRCGNHPSGSSAEFSSATAAASTLTETAAADLIPPQSLRQLPAVVPDWPPELSAAEERDAWEEAYYFGWVSVAPSLSQQPHLQGRRSTTSHRDRASSDREKGHPQGKHGTSTTDVEGCVGGSSGQVQRIRSHTLATCSVAASPAALKRQQWWLDAEVQPPTLYLNRQRRSSRRRSRVAYPSDMFRSSTARRAGATSAAAELFGRHKDAHPTSAADATAAAPTSMKAVGDAVPEPTEGADLPASSSHTRASCVTRSHLTLYNDGPPRKKAAQLFYPDPSLHGVGVPPPSPFTKHDHRTISQVTVGTETMERGSGVAHAQQHQQHMEVDSSAAEDGQVKIEASAVQPRRSAIEQVVEKSCCDGGEEEAGAAGSGLGWQLSARSGADGPHCSSSNLTCDATDSTAATPACTPEAAAPVDMTAPRPCADVDVIFFFQKFVRAVLIVFIAQVRLQQLQEQQELELHVDHLHSSTCPAEACLLGRHGGRTIPSDPAAATAAAEVPNGVGLSKLERSALSFVRHYMADYRHMITTYVMRNDREVARRSAQAILTPPQSTAAALSTSPPSAVGATDAAGREASSAPDPLFQQAVLARWLRADRVNTVYEEAVSVATGGVPGDADANPPATPVDDVEPLRVAQVYISGKDAAWQPLLMELLRVRRVVQCYSDGPVVAATGSASAASPQRLLLASLEKFLVQPTLPLLRRAGSSGSEVAQAGSTTPASPTAPSTSTTTAVSGSPASDLCTATALSLTPAQAVAAALMVEESDAFRAYLLSGYLREDAAADGNSATAGTDFAAKTATTMLRHSQSAPTLTATGMQQWPRSSVSPAAAMPSFTVGHAMSSHPQPQQPQSPNLPLNSGSLLQPLTWYPYAYMPGTANPYAESVDPYTAHTAPAPAAAASAMTLSVAMLPLSGRLLWRWVVPAEDTDNFNLSVFFQSSLFSFMQGGPLPMPSAPPDWLDAAAGTAAGRGAVGYVPTPMAMRMAPSLSPHPSLAWPPALAARIDAQLRDDAFRNAWDGVLSSCTCGTAASAVHKEHGSGSDLWGEMPEVTLVHCSAGMHRSCGILVAFLLWLLYQCRQVLCTEKALGLGPLSGTGVPAPPLPAGTEITHAAAVKSLLLDDVDALAPAAASAGDGEDEEQLEQRTKNTAADADTPWLTSRLLRRTIRHVQQQRSIAVPIRTVQYLLQSFANELRLP
ncbi:hypothetical protein, conserved [Leishmania tarentolae]|uniref:Uncharacterized protein n=1 Tax=Leishmania tarentolae TaxID=5689 RepID=A0A640K8W0_LEITA|nr:hypothetical protein, conserved [Leishmania tarentolae]